MITISQAVQRVVAESPFLREALSEEVASISKVARKIKPRVERILYETVSEASIVMALRRLHAADRSSAFGTDFLHDLSDITVRSNLVEFVFLHSPDLPRLQQKILNDLGKDPEVFLDISHGIRESVIIVSKTAASYVEELLGDQKHVRCIADLSSITIRLPEASLSVPGVYYPILKALALEGISFVEIISVATELTIVFENTEVDRAFRVIKGLGGEAG